MTPYLVQFTTKDGLYCEILEPNGDEYSITNFLKNVDIIRKEDIRNYVSKLWSEKD